MSFKNFSDLIFTSSTINDGDMSAVFSNKKTALESRKKFLKKHQINPQKLIVLSLEHKSKVIIVSKKDLGKNLKADALITNDKNIVLGILTADCLPVAVYDSRNKVLALIHASVYNIDSIIDKTIEVLNIKYNTNPKELIVEIGPSIGPCHFRKDLWQEALDILTRNKIPLKNITNKKICTYESFHFSHRRSVEEREMEGRFITIASLV